MSKSKSKLMRVTPLIPHVLYYRESSGRGPPPILRTREHMPKKLEGESLQEISDLQLFIACWKTP